MNTPSVQLFDINFSAITQSQAIHTILEWTNRQPERPKMVVTPNVNLTLLSRSNPKFRDVLNNAALCLVDGRPIYWASLWFGKRLPEVVTGSDLVPALFRACPPVADRQECIRVYLLGAAEGVAKRAAERIEAQYPSVRICGTFSPPIGFEHDPEKCEVICNSIREAKTQILIIGLGAPKQEMWAYKNLQHTGAHVAICAGATIDFLAGEKPRAPAWMSQTGLEWLFRIITEPKRLAKRYWKDGLALPALFWQEYRKQKSGDR